MTPDSEPKIAGDTSVYSQADTLGNAEFYLIKAIEAGPSTATGQLFLQKAKTWAAALNEDKYDFSLPDPKV